MTDLYIISTKAKSKYFPLRARFQTINLLVTLVLSSLIFKFLPIFFLNGQEIEIFDVLTRCQKKKFTLFYQKNTSYAKQKL